MAASIRQNYSSSTEFTCSRDSENGVRIRLLTSDNGKLLLTIPAAEPDRIKLSLDDDARKAVNSNYTSAIHFLRQEFHFRSRESRRNVDNHHKTLAITSRDDMSFSAKLR